MTLPEEFVLIDRIVHYHPDLADILKDKTDLAFAMKADSLERVMRYTGQFTNTWTPFLHVKKGDIITYRGYKIHAV